MFSILLKCIYGTYSRVKYILAYKRFDTSIYEKISKRF